jgi:hypothetical protein
VLRLTQNYIRGRAVGRSAWVRLPSRELRTYMQGCGPAVGRSTWSGCLRLAGCGPAVGRSGRSGCLGAIGMRSGGRSVRLVRLPGEPQGCGPAVGRSGWSGCLGAIGMRLETALGTRISPVGMISVAVPFLQIVSCFGCSPSKTGERYKQSYIW